MKTLLLFFTLVTSTYAQPEFQVGLYADDSRSITCTTGIAGDEFEQILWAFVPEDLALSYLTIRFRFPSNLAFPNRPVFNDQIGHVIFTDYVMNTVEWNMVFTECPSGWVKVFSQTCVMLDDEVSLIEMLGAHSLARDCAFFALNDVTILNELAVNDSECGQVPTTDLAWGAIKSLYR